jgi:hypothetical protein
MTCLMVCIIIIPFKAQTIMLHLFFSAYYVADWIKKARLFMQRNEWHKKREAVKRVFFLWRHTQLLLLQDLLYISTMFHWRHLFHHNSRLLFPLFIHNSSRGFCTNILSHSHTSCTWPNSARLDNYSGSDTSNFIIITTVINIECGCVKLLRFW